MKIKITLCAILLLNLNCYASDVEELSKDAREQITKIDKSFDGVPGDKLAAVVMATSPKSTYKIIIMCFNKDFENCKLRMINLDVPKSTTIGKLKDSIAQKQNCYAEDIKMFTANRHAHDFPLSDMETLEEIQSKDRSSIWALNTKGQFPK